MEHALSGRATVRPRRPSRPPRHARLARPTIGEDRVHLEQRAEGELQELGRQNCSTSFDNVAEDAGVLGRDDGAQGAAPLSQLTSMKVSKASVSSSYHREQHDAPDGSMPILITSRGVDDFIQYTSRGVDEVMECIFGVSSPYVRVRVSSCIFEVYLC